jgi:hypothetical protein
VAFNKANWASGNISANAPALHTYVTADTSATLNTAGYFNSIVGQLRVGDFIFAYCDTGGTPQGYVFCVNSNSGTAVDVTDGLAIGTTDTD